MKIKFLILLALLCASPVCGAEIVITKIKATDAIFSNLSSGNARVGGVINGRINANLFANFSTAVHDPSTAGKVIEVTENITCNTLTIPSDRQIVFNAGKVLTIAIDQVLTFLGSFNAGTYQVFNALGSVTGLKEARPAWFGENTTHGTTDMSPALQSALTASKHVILTNGENYYCASGVSIVNAGTIIDFNGATVTGNTGIDVFTVPHTVNNTKFLRGTITGPYASAIKTTGTGSVLASTGSYDMTIDDMKLLVGDVGIYLYQRFDRAYITNNNIFTSNGILIHGKIADIYIANNIIAGGQVVGSYGVRTYNPVGTLSNYPEGVTMANNIVTNHATEICLDDIYVFSFVGGFIQPSLPPFAGGKSVQIGLDRATTFAKYIKFSDTTFSYGPFVVSESAYNADYNKYISMSNCQFTSTYIQIDANSHFIKMDNLQFISPDAVTSVVTIGDNVTYTTISNVTVYGNYTNGVVITGTTGGKIKLENWTWEDGGGYPAIVKLTTARPVTSINMDPAYEHAGATIAAGTTVAGAVLKTLVFHIGAYQKFHINLSIDYTTATAHLLTFAFSPNILGWYGGITIDSVTIPAASAANHFTHQLSGIAGADGDVTITVTNGAADLVITGSLSYIAAEAL